MGEVESQLLTFPCVKEDCEGGAELNLDTQHSLPAWGLCDKCGRIYLYELSEKQKMTITEEGSIEEIDPEKSRIEMVLAETLTFQEEILYQLSRVEKRSKYKEMVSEGMAEAAGMSDAIPVPEEVEELLSEANIKVKTVRLILKDSEPMWRTLAEYYGQEVRKIIDEGRES